MVSLYWISPQNVITKSTRRLTNWIVIGGSRIDRVWIATITIHINWELVCGKQVSSAGTANYITQYVWSVITCPCLWYPVTQSTVVNLQAWCWLQNYTCFRWSSVYNRDVFFYVWIILPWTKVNVKRLPVWVIEKSIMRWRFQHFDDDMPVPQFCRRHFQTHFLEWICYNFD